MIALLEWNCHRWYDRAVPVVITAVDKCFRSNHPCRRYWLCPNPSFRLWEVAVACTVSASIVLTGDGNNSCECWSGPAALLALTNVLERLQGSCHFRILTAAMTTRTMVGQEPSLFLLFSAIDSALSVTNHHGGRVSAVDGYSTNNGIRYLFITLSDNEVLRRIF